MADEQSPMEPSQNGAERTRSQSPVDGPRRRQNTQNSSYPSNIALRRRPREPQNLAEPESPPHPRRRRRTGYTRPEPPHPSLSPSTSPETRHAQRNQRRRPRASMIHTGALHQHNDLLWQRGYFGDHDRVRDRGWLASRVGLGKHAVIKRENGAMDDLLGPALGKVWREHRQLKTHGKKWRKTSLIGSLSAWMPTGYTPPATDFRPEGTRLPSPAPDAPRRRRRPRRRRSPSPGSRAEERRSRSPRTPSGRTAPLESPPTRGHRSRRGQPPPPSIEAASALAPPDLPSHELENAHFFRPAWPLPDPDEHLAAVRHENTRTGIYNMEARMRLWTSEYFRDLPRHPTGAAEEGVAGEDEDEDEDEADDDGDEGSEWNGE